jgi:hypothetical protein
VDKDFPTTTLRCFANRRRRRGRGPHHHRYQKQRRCFDSKEIRLNHDAAPPGAGVAIPDQRRRDFAEAENKIISSIFIEIGNDSASLFGGWAGDW